MQAFFNLLNLVPNALAATWIFIGTSWLNEKAIDFGSSNTTKYISMGDNFNFSWADDFTMCAWFYAHSAWEAPLFSRENGSTGNGWDFRYTSANKLQWYSSGSSAARRIQVTSSGTFSTGTWRHICFVYTGNQSATGISFVVDGSAVSTTTNFNTSTEDWAQASINFRVNAWSNLTTYGRAKMDEITIWNDNLSTSEIGELISGGKPTNPVTTSMWATKNLSYYRMGDLTDSTSTIVDRGMTGGVDGTPTALVSGDIVTSVP